MRNIVWTEYGSTVLTPPVMALAAIFGVCLLLLERRYALVPVIAAGLFITHLQRIVIAGVDLDIARLMLVALWLRILLRGEYQSFEINSLDKAIGIWVAFSIVTYVALWKTGSALMYRFGWTFDALAAYAAVRVLVRGPSDIRVIARASLIMAVFVAGFMIVEHTTQRNLFADMGGVAAYSAVREGRVRTQAAFSHPIMAGTWGASLLPLAWALSKEPQAKFDRQIATVGLMACLLIVLFSSSSGPLLSLAAGVFALACWRIRFNLRSMKVIGLTGILALQFVMKDPVWALLAKVTVVGGSTGYHRFFLVDQAIRRFDEWWFIGTKSTAHWGWGLQDITNMYVKVGVEGGLLSLVLFIWLLRGSFRAAGNSARSADGRVERVYSWMLGSVLFVHVVSFVGASYFGQMIFIFFMLLGQIGSLVLHSEHVRGTRLAREVRV